MVDVLIVGGGVCGCAAARELSRFRLKIVLLEKGPDIASGTSGANSAIVHAGYDALPGSLKAVLNVRGNAMFDRLSKELDFPFVRNGSLVLAFRRDDIPKLEELAARGRENGVPDLAIVDAARLHEMDPHVSPQAVAALYAPTGGIVCPYEYTLALAENALHNGVEFRFDTAVTGMEKTGGGFLVHTPAGDLETRMVVNAAGLYADEINNMVSVHKLRILPRKGEYCLFDRAVGYLANHTLFQLPTAMGKGVLVTRTVDGNLLVGPSAADQTDKTDVSTTREGIDSILKAAERTIGRLPMKQVITSFAGLRAHGGEDFMIGEAPDAPGFLNVASIESPGLSASPAIAQMVAETAVSRLNPQPNPDFDPIRRGIPRFRDMDNDARKAMIAKDPAWGHIICRCETVTEGEILEAIRRPLGARTIDGVKRRTRAGMGRCQAGFCTPRVVDILSRELGVSPTRVTKSGGGSNLLVGVNKEI